MVSLSEYQAKRSRPNIPGLFGVLYLRGMKPGFYSRSPGFIPSLGPSLAETSVVACVGARPIAPAAPAATYICPWHPGTAKRPIPSPGTTVWWPFTRHVRHRRQRPLSAQDAHPPRRPQAGCRWFAPHSADGEAGWERKSHVSTPPRPRVASRRAALAIYSTARGGEI